MTDALLDEIARHPEVDDARLVWADREGGERGELVIVQCALARGGQRRDERRTLYAREAELLAKTWPETEGLEGPRFERGFVVHAQVRIDDLAKHLERHPFLTSIAIADARIDIVDGEVEPRWLDTGERLAQVFAKLAPGRVAKVLAEPVIWSDGQVPRTESYAEEFLRLLSETAAGRALRAVQLATPLPARALEWLAAWSDLEELRIGGDLSVRAVHAFAETHPRLARLSLSRRGVRSQTVDVPTFLNATELELCHAGFGDVHVRALANVDRPNLRRLGLPWTDITTYACNFLAQSTRLASLEALDISGTKLGDDDLGILASAPFAANLRELTAQGMRLTGAALPHLLAFPKLDRIDLRSSYLDTSAFRPLKDAIPSVLL